MKRPRDKNIVELYSKYRKRFSITFKLRQKTRVGLRKDVTGKRAMAQSTCAI